MAPFKTHEENRLYHTCLGCTKKAKDLRRMTARQKEVFLKFYPDFFKDEDYLPASMGSCCRRILMTHAAGSVEMARPMPQTDWKALANELRGLAPATRSSAGVKCQCTNCLVARQTINPEPSKYYHPPPTEPKVEEQFECPKCHISMPISQVESHKCPRDFSRKNVAKRIWEGASPQTRAALQSYLEKEVGNAKKKVKVATDNLAELMRSGLSKNEAIRVGTIINKIDGVKMSPEYRNKLAGLLHEVDDFFEIRQLQLLSKAKNEEEDYKGPNVLEQEEIYAIICKDVPEYAEHIKAKNGLTGVPCIHKIGLDSGQGSLKVTLSIQRDDGPRASGEPTPGPSGLARRITGAISKVTGRGEKYKDSGVKQIHVLALIPKIPENYANIKTIMAELNLEKFNYQLASDFKLINMAVGQQGHRSTYPCPFCKSKGRGKGCADFEDGYEAELRTFGFNREQAKKFQSSPKIAAKDCYNCVNEPVLDAEDDDYILDIIFISSLHINLGLVFKILNQLDQDLGDKGWVLAWLKTNSILGERDDNLNDLNGPATTKFFRKLPQLRADLIKLKATSLLKYVDVAQALSDVRTACFGSEPESLDPNYEDKIKHLEELWHDAGISVTTKAHVLFRHVPEQITKYQMPLGKYSEQAVEACHHDFLQHYKGYKRLSNTKDYAQKLLQAVCSYNSLHLKK